VMKTESNRERRGRETDRQTERQSETGRVRTDRQKEIYRDRQTVLD
jgi:hypothetical protein